MKNHIDICHYIYYNMSNNQRVNWGFGRSANWGWGIGR